jgi:hypothetical protein
MSASSQDRRHTLLEEATAGIPVDGSNEIFTANIQWDWHGEL